MTGVVVLGACAGCSSFPIGTCSPALAACDPDLDLGAWCGDNGTCTVDAEPLHNPIFVAPGQTIRARYGSFAPILLGKSRDLEIGVIGGPSFKQSGITARLDGVPGTLMGHWFTYVHWDPFPSSPQELEIEIPASLPVESINGRTIELTLNFLDGACVDAAGGPCGR